MRLLQHLANSSFSDGCTGNLYCSLLIEVNQILKIAASRKTMEKPIWKSLTFFSIEVTIASWHSSQNSHPFLMGQYNYAQSNSK